MIFTYFSVYMSDIRIKKIDYTKLNRPTKNVSLIYAVILLTTVPYSKKIKLTKQNFPTKAALTVTNFYNG